MAYELSFRVDRLPSMPNAGIAREHWAIRARHRKLWLKEVWAATAGKRPPAPLTSARVECVRSSSAWRSPDFDNLAISFKPVLDALVALDILADDDPGTITPVYRWEKGKLRHGYITVEVTENAPGE